MAKSQPVYIRRGKNIMKAIKNVGYRHSNWQVFQDFIAMSAIAISNAVDWMSAKTRESEYMEIVKRYNAEELDNIVKALSTLTIEITEIIEGEGSPYDILGEVFHGLELHNECKGQFFTPNHVARFMGDISITDSILDGAKEKEYISVCEPCVGSGVLVLGFAAAMKKYGMDYQRGMCVTACDIDIRCVHMAYIQLSLYGIPAKIIHGNSLTGEIWSTWYTPVYMIGGWPLKENVSMEQIARATETMEQNKKDNKAEAITQIVNEDGQFCMF